MQPIVPIDTQRSAAQNRPKRLGDVMAFILATATALGVLALAAYFFYGFFDTDKGVLTLLSSFAICFGVAASAFIPAALIARAARKSMGEDAKFGDYGLCAWLLLPWIVIASITVMGETAIPPLYGVGVLLLCGALLFWAILRAIAFRKTRTHP